MSLLIARWMRNNLSLYQTSRVVKSFFVSLILLAACASTSGDEETDEEETTEEVAKESGEEEAEEDSETTESSETDGSLPTDLPPVDETLNQSAMSSDTTSSTALQDPFAASGEGTEIVSQESSQTFQADPLPNYEETPTQAESSEPSSEPTQSTPSDGSLPENGATLVYYVLPNDTLSKIAQKIYGNSSRWKELQSLNGLKNPNLIHTGEVIYYKLDDSSRAFAQAYESLPNIQHTVQKGDTLSRIARRYLGNVILWPMIWYQNSKQISNPHVIQIGLHLVFKDISGRQQTTAQTANINPIARIVASQKITTLSKSDRSSHKESLKQKR